MGRNEEWAESNEEGGRARRRQRSARNLGGSRAESKAGPAGRIEKSREKVEVFFVFLGLVLPSAGFC